MRIYENILKTSENRLPQRAYYIPKGKSEYTLLNGEWRFAFFDKEIDVPDVINEWDITPVPSCWQTEGYENPNYSNICYPYPYSPPYVPDDNPCGIYERDFQIDKLWGNVYFVLEGVSSCGIVYVNDNYVGFTQGSHLQAEFDVTSFVKEGKNTVRVKVLKWSVGSYLECQDFFRMNGIFRDTYLLQRPADHISDVHVKAENASVSVETDKDSFVRVYDMTGALIGEAKGSSVQIPVENPVLWNAEKPYLYTVVIEHNDEVVEIFAGFRTIEISDTYQLLINGQSVKLHGVNHHDTHPTNGWCESNEELEKELLLMKQLHINCIRTSHYPPTPYFLNLCDKLGFYVVLETDIETHGCCNMFPDWKCGYEYCDSLNWLCSKPDWKNEYVERMVRAVMRDRNHASIIMWSTGNESGHGANHVAMCDYVRSLGDGRLLHCEDATRLGSPDHADVFSRMYLGFDDLKSKAEDPNIKMPVYLCEYSHAMGNGPGDVWDYSELFDSYDKLIGGCIWEWADHTVIIDGVQKYGGDFEGELTHDGNFCCDGMVFADRSLKSGSLEVKAAYQPMKTSLDGNVLKVYNRMDFTNLDEYRFTYSVETDGEVIASSETVLCVEPHNTADVVLDIPELSARLGAFVTCRLYKGDMEVAHTQHALEFTKIREKYSEAKADFAETQREIIITGNNFRYVFDKHYGNFTSMVVDGKENLAGLIKLTSWRAPTDNERRIKVKWGNYNTWQGENLNRHFSKVYETVLNGDTICVKGDLSGVSHAPYFSYTATYRINGRGEVEVTLGGKYREDACWMPRLGFEFILPAENKEFTYYGYGPYESYCDMHHASSVGLYKSNVDNEYVNYVRPQEHGNHYAVKELKIGDLVFSGNFEANVSNYDAYMLDAAEHTDELKSDGFVHLRIDYKDSGIGSNSCGPALLEKYQLNEKQVRFEYKIAPNK